MSETIGTFPCTPEAYDVMYQDSRLDALYREADRDPEYIGIVGDYLDSAVQDQWRFFGLYPCYIGQVFPVDGKPSC
jgi:hypothetical protein